MLTFNLKKEWFEKIKRGEKTVEYREVKPYWTKRIAKNKEFAEMLKRNGETGVKCFSMIKFVLGYSDTKYFYAYVENIAIIPGINTDLKIDKPVYAIHFRLTGDKQ